MEVFVLVIGLVGSIVTIGLFIGSVVDYTRKRAEPESKPSRPTLKPVIASLFLSVILVTMCSILFIEWRDTKNENARIKHMRNQASDLIKLWANVPGDKPRLDATLNDQGDNQGIVDTAAGFFLDYRTCMPGQATVAEDRRKDGNIAGSEAKWQIDAKAAFRQVEALTVASPPSCP